MMRYTVNPMLAQDVTRIDFDSDDEDMYDFGGTPLHKPEAKTEDSVSESGDDIEYTPNPLHNGGMVLKNGGTQDAIPNVEGSLSSVKAYTNNPLHTVRSKDTKSRPSHSSNLTAATAVGSSEGDGRKEGVPSVIETNEEKL